MSHITGTNGDVAQGNNHQQVATTEPGDLPDILHWDGCADRQVKKKSGSIKSALQRSWSNSEENRYAGGRIYGPFQCFAGGEKARYSHAAFVEDLL